MNVNQMTVRILSRRHLLIGLEIKVFRVLDLLETSVHIRAQITRGHLIDMIQTLNKFEFLSQKIP